MQKRNLNTTFGRGLAPTDADGVVQFVSKFPGHYAGRATHIHTLGNHNGQVLANRTYVGTNASSISRLFFDQKLISNVEATSVYAANKVAITPNSADKLLADAAASDFDPVVQYVYLGDKVEDGIFAWISIGVDMGANMPVNPAASWTKTGGAATVSANTKPGKGEHGGPGGHGGKPRPVTGSNGTDSDNSQEHETTDDIIPGGRNPLFSVTFFFLSSGTLVFLLRKYRVRPQPQRKYGALETA